jgi:RND family efflux transporter MFP subunit
MSPDFVEGAHVPAGALLMKLDPIDYIVAVAEATANLADANLSLTEERNEFRRGTSYRANNKQEVASSLRQPKFALVEARYKAAEEKLKQAKADLAATEISAPFDAVVDNKQVDLGQYVASNAPLFSLFSTTTAEVRLPVTAAEIYFIDAIPAAGGVMPKVQLSASFGITRQQWQGRLVRVERRVDANTRTFFVVADVDKPYDTERYTIPLSVGLFVDAVIDGITIEQGVRVPRSSLHDDNYVYVVNDGTLTSRAVTVARRAKDSIVISDGLNNGDQLVMTKLDLMVEGMRVTAMSENRNETELSVGSPVAAE